MLNPIVEKEKLDKYIKMMADIMQSAGEILHYTTLIYLMVHLETSARETLGDIGKEFPDMIPVIKAARILKE